MEEQKYFLVDDCGKCYSLNPETGRYEWSVWKTYACEFTQKEIDAIISISEGESLHKIKAE